MNNLIPIQYREFYDVPRMFIVAYQGVSYLFDASFNEKLDDYPDTYAVSVLPPLLPEELTGSWSSLPSRVVSRLTQVLVSAVPFDKTRRQGVEQEFLHAVLSGEHTQQKDYLTLDGQKIDLDIVKAANPNEGWIELYDFVILADGGKRLVTQVDTEKGDERPVIQRKFGRVGTLSTAA
jgi:hypothetical protein